MPAPVVAAERFLLALFLAWLVWLPMPFGSVVDGARLPLILPPLLLCAAAAALRGSKAGPRSRRTESNPSAESAPNVGNDSTVGSANVVVAGFGSDRKPGLLQSSKAWRLFTLGGLLLAVLVAVQLIPLPPSLLRAVSPRSASIWNEGWRVATLIQDQPSPAAAHPISIDPAATMFEFFRLLALLATFQTAALLVRNGARRISFAVALSIAAVFEVLYGVREAALGRYAIWGWVNHLIFNRVTGTFVNPNHFAHYESIVMPMAIYLTALAWHRTEVPQHRAAAPDTVPRRLTRLVERQIVPFSFGVLAALSCLTAVLVAQSRGALAAIGGGLTIVAAASMFARDRRIVPIAAKLSAGVVAGLLLVGGLVAYLGHERTVERFRPNAAEQVTFVGRRVGLESALGIWRMFPIFGSGAGTFHDVVAMTQRDDLEKLYDHAHDDYVELAATTGSLGFLVAVGALLGGWLALARGTFGSAAKDISWGRRAFQTAALTSLTVAMVHALFDFNFYIPANPATLAAIIGAAIATRR